MAHVWTKTTKTFLIDGTHTDNAPEAFSTPGYVYTTDLLEVEGTYNTTAPHVYIIRREVRLLDGDGEIIYSTLVDVRFTNTTTSVETIEEKYSEDGDWVLRQTWDTSVRPPTDVLGYFTKFNGFVQPGTRELWESFSVDGVVMSSHQLIGTFDIRALALRDIRSDKYRFNPLKEGTTIKADVVALPAPGDSYLYPSGWTSGSISWEYELDRRTLSLPSGSGTESAASTPDPGTGKIAEIRQYWDGYTTDEKIVEGPVKISFRILADVPGTGNSYNQSAGESSPFCRRCKDLCDTSRTGELTLDLSLPVAGIGSVMSYFSSLAGNLPASMGYGWRSASSARMSETSGGDLVYETENDMVMRWTPDGLGSYTPVNGDNYLTAEKDGTELRIITKDKSVREFDSAGRVSADIDRNGNTVTYAYNTNGHIESVDDGMDRVVYYDYGSRTDGQPVAVRSDDPVTGREVRLEYYSDSDSDAPGRLFRIIYPEGETTEFEYLPEGPIKKITQVRPVKGDQVVDFTYDSYGRLASETVNNEVQTVHGHGIGYINSNYSDPYDITSVQILDLSLEEPYRYPLRETIYYYNLDGNLVRIEEGEQDEIVAD